MSNKISPLAKMISRHVQDKEYSEPIIGVHLHRVTNLKRLHIMTNTGLCIVAQGQKEIFLDSRSYLYNRDKYLLVTAELPVIVQFEEVSLNQPYLSLRIELDPRIVGEVLLESGCNSINKEYDVTALTVKSIGDRLHNPVMRLLSLTENREDERFLKPLIMREIIFMLIKDGHHSRLRHLAIQGGHGNKITKAIVYLKKSYDQTVKMEKLADELGMSTSSFHHHFKAVTSLSPLQYQKKIRLHKARELMLNDDLDASSTAYRVGYYDASHFSREYKRMFGTPPLKDIENMKKGRSEERPRRLTMISMADRIHQS